MKDPNAFPFTSLLVFLVLCLLLFNLFSCGEGHAEWKWAYVSPHSASSKPFCVVLSNQRLTCYTRASTAQADADELNTFLARQRDHSEQ